MATRIQKETAERMISKLQGELDSLFEKQEMGKGGRMAMKCGGSMRPKAQGGLELGNTLLGMSPYTGSMVNQPGLGLSAGLAGLVGNAGQGLMQSPIGGTSYIPQVSFGNLSGAGKVNRIFGGPGMQRGLNIAGNALGAAAGLAPIGYNAFRAFQPAEQLNYQDFRNPEYGRSTGLYNQAASLMANRRYDPSAALENIEQQGAVYRQGLRNLPQSTGGLQNRLAGASVREGTQRGQTLRDAQNINLGLKGEQAQFLGQQAGFLGNLGAQDVQTRFGINQINAQNLAARNRFGAEAATNAQQYALIQQLMANQKKRDEQLFNLLETSNYRVDPKTGRVIYI